MLRLLKKVNKSLHWQSQQHYTETIDEPFKCGLIMRNEEILKFIKE
ncbi:hypothetical protein yberc0001_31320 [Yersinia bercovieri ATCC 43970]|uniref:Uncharacterized protein n=1 Tax=Yersinia bercovieri ATCC 43970 TaxID=349968 RepID=A0ABP2E0T9_YERBE|nr:hypothetical protein yberc0001_31320 [Yersinia bercovieri ATCC 43970]